MTETEKRLWTPRPTIVDPLAARRRRRAAERALNTLRHGPHGLALAGWELADAGRRSA
jgi:hypothetical protein